MSALEHSGRAAWGKAAEAGHQAHTDLVLTRAELREAALEALFSARLAKLTLADPLELRVRRVGLVADAVVVTADADANDAAGSGWTCEGPEAAGWTAAMPFTAAAALVLARLVCLALVGVLLAPSAVCCSARMTERSSWLAMYGRDESTTEAQAVTACAIHVRRAGLHKDAEWCQGRSQRLMVCPACSRSCRY